VTYLASATAYVIIDVAYVVIRLKLIIRFCFENDSCLSRTFETLRKTQLFPALAPFTRRSKPISPRATQAGCAEQTTASRSSWQSSAHEACCRAPARFARACALCSSRPRVLLPGNGTRHFTASFLRQERLEKEKQLTKNLGAAANKLQTVLKQTQDQLNKERLKNQSLAEKVTFGPPRFQRAQPTYKFTALCFPLYDLKATCFGALLGGPFQRITCWEKSCILLVMSSSLLKCRCF